MTTEQSPPTTLSEERLRELKELYSKATPGPFTVRYDQTQNDCIHIGPPDGNGSVADFYNFPFEQDLANAEFLAALHNAFPSLLHAAEQMAMYQWQPIERAPRDETVIWAFNGEQGRMKWSEGDGWGLWIWDDEVLMDVDPSPTQPTHWMALPPAPEKQEGGAAKPKNDAGWATCTSCGTYDWLVSHEPYPGICAKCAAKEGGAA